MFINFIAVGRGVNVAGAVAGGVIAFVLFTGLLITTIIIIIVCVKVSLICSSIIGRNNNIYKE